jgi:hypothetical protein
MEDLLFQVHPGSFGPEKVVGGVGYGGNGKTDGIRMDASDRYLVDEGDESVLVRAIYQERLAGAPEWSG